MIVSVGLWVGLVFVIVVVLYCIWIFRCCGLPRVVCCFDDFDLCYFVWFVSWLFWVVDI